MEISEEQVQRLWQAREAIRDAVDSQRSSIAHISVIALLDAAIDIGDVVLELRQSVLFDLESAA